jgi:hypothetical protein
MQYLFRWGVILNTVVYLRRRDVERSGVAITAQGRLYSAIQVRQVLHNTRSTKTEAGSGVNPIPMGLPGYIRVDGGS